MHNKSENLLGQDESFYEAEIQQGFDDLHEFNIIHNARAKHTAGISSDMTVDESSKNGL